MAGGGVKINNITVTGGANGRTATFKIENGKLYNSYDSGLTWYELGQVAGDNGTDGQDGKGFNPRGVWQPNTTYYNDSEKIDVVKYGADSYYCKITHTGGSDPEHDSIYWGLLVEGGVAGEFYFGTGITGKSTTPLVFAGSGVEYACVGDIYWNMSNGESRGNIYKCKVEGDVSTAQWAFVGNISTTVGEYDNISTQIDYSIEPNTEKTFNASNITNITIRVPNTTYQGFISEVDVFIGSSVPTISFVNSGSKPLKFVNKGEVLQSNYTIPQTLANGEVNLLFRDNGASILCAILEL